MNIHLFWRNCDWDTPNKRWGLELGEGIKNTVSIYLSILKNKRNRQSMTRPYFNNTKKSRDGLIQCKQSVRVFRNSSIIIHTRKFLFSYYYWNSFWSNLLVYIFFQVVAQSWGLINTYRSTPSPHPHSFSPKKSSVETWIHFTILFLNSWD